MPVLRLKRPNIVFVLTDDLAWNLRPVHAARRRQLQRQGTTFTNYFVTDSLCCPSRASIFTGRYPARHGRLHATAGPTAASSAFHARGEESDTFATAPAGAPATAPR